MKEIGIEFNILAHRLNSVMLFSLLLSLFGKAIENTALLSCTQHWSGKEKSFITWHSLFL